MAGLLGADGWHADQLPIPREAIIAHSANMHLIPAAPEVWMRLKRVRPGQVVRLRGYLVSVNAPDGWRWDSSLSRTDTGAGGCELLWVEGVSLTG